MKDLSEQQLQNEKGIPLSSRQLKRLENAGRFPRRVRLSANRVAWIESEIDQWCSDRNQARQAA
jgi:prophage regulatory protein